MGFVKALTHTAGLVLCAVAFTGSALADPEAHHHVIVCHRTGSETNPYVVINIPWTAWSEAHSPDTGSHPDLNGHHDIMLKDPASRPGSKDGFTTSDVLGEVASSPSLAETATTGTLPFTGVPLWIAALLGGGLLATGFALRRAAQH